jgi:anti-sigma B factor antagonist
MDLREEAVSDVTVVAVEGRLDTQTAAHFSKRLAELVRSGHHRVLVEGSCLSYVSSAGFHALLLAAKLATESGGKLSVCSLSAPIKRTVEIGGFNELFDTYCSREEALAKLSAS